MLRTDITAQIRMMGVVRHKRPARIGPGERYLGPQRQQPEDEAFAVLNMAETDIFNVHIDDTHLQPTDVPSPLIRTVLDMEFPVAIEISLRIVRQECNFSMVTGLVCSWSHQNSLSPISARASPEGLCSERVVSTVIEAQEGPMRSKLQPFPMAILVTLLQWPR